MVYSAGCKINIGLSIVERRQDGFHNLETVMYPIKFMVDIVEVVNSETFSFSSSGRAIDCPSEKNLSVKAYRLLEQKLGKLPPLAIHLHKQNPFGAGLGSGSSDATVTLLAINECLKLNLSQQSLIEYAAELGSDTPFFVRNCAQLCKGRGEIMEDIAVDLSPYTILVVKPNFSISTKEAFSSITPKAAQFSLSLLPSTPIERWKELVINDFEEGLFIKYPLLAQIKQQLYDMGALYASMSGSGSALYAIFKELPNNIDSLKEEDVELFYGKG